MQEATVRARYVRNSLQSRRRRRRYGKGNTILFENLARQVFISILILAVIGLIKSISSPVTRYMSKSIEKVLFYNIDLKAVYEEVRSLFKKDKATDGLTDDSDRQPVNKADYKFIAPVEGFITSPYGERIHPLRQVKEIHSGVDIEAEKGAPIKAAADGTVIEAGSNSSYGNYLKIRHDERVTTVYAHCSRLAAKKGQQVKQGEVIAYTGDTGLSVGTHLHFEILLDGKSVDPEEYIAFDEAE